MKKSMWSKMGSMSLAGSILIASCAPLTEEAMSVEQAIVQEQVINEATSTDLNARKAAERNYFERFENQIGFRPGPGFDPISGFPAYYPGSGIGNSSHMGKAYSFLNQLASLGTDGLGTVGAPIVDIYGEELEKMGLTGIPNEVSSLTTDGKGNSVWFKNIQNIVVPTSETRMDFQAEVEIIGGTGKFKKAKGTALVEGYFNPINGAGMSTIQGRIEF
ncbi:hypothetical protein JYB64_06835 [Algoriphagus aestuarii]|nr:hypothetical protein [Algoriphagus aestuarii]